MPTCMHAHTNAQITHCNQLICNFKVDCFPSVCMFTFMIFVICLYIERMWLELGSTCTPVDLAGTTFSSVLVQPVDFESDNFLHARRIPK